MKRLWLALLVMVMTTSAVSAQEVNYSATPAPAQPPDTACEPGCVKTVCVPQPAKKTTRRTVYDVECVEYCLPKCPGLFSLFGGGCGDGCAGECGKPRTRHVLIKKVVREERDTYNCVPVNVPGSPSCSNP